MRASIDDLPDELLLICFLRLTSWEERVALLRVCRRWRGLAVDRALWHVSAPIVRYGEPGPPRYLSPAQARAVFSAMRGVGMTAPRLNVSMVTERAWNPTGYRRRVRRGDKRPEQEKIVSLGPPEALGAEFARALTQYACEDLSSVGGSLLRRHMVFLGGAPLRTTLHVALWHGASDPALLNKTLPRLTSLVHLSIDLQTKRRARKFPDVSGVAGVLFALPLELQSLKFVAYTHWHERGLNLAQLRPAHRSRMMENLRALHMEAKFDLSNGHAPPSLPGDMFPRLERLVLGKKTCSPHAALGAALRAWNEAEEGPPPSLAVYPALQELTVDARNGYSLTCVALTRAVFPALVHVTVRESIAFDYLRAPPDGFLVWSTSVFGLLPSLQRLAINVDFERPKATGVYYQGPGSTPALAQTVHAATGLEHYLSLDETIFAKGSSVREWTASVDVPERGFALGVRYEKHPSRDVAYEAYDHERVEHLWYTLTRL